jgi:hypothetical protein
VGFTTQEFDRLVAAFGSSRVADAVPVARRADVSVWHLSKRTTNTKALCRTIRLKGTLRCKRHDEYFIKGSWTLSVSASYEGPRCGEPAGTRHKPGTRSLVYFCARADCVSVSALAKHDQLGLVVPALTWPVLLVGEDPTAMESAELTSFGLRWSR